MACVCILFLYLLNFGGAPKLDIGGSCKSSLLFKLMFSIEFSFTLFSSLSTRSLSFLLKFPPQRGHFPARFLTFKV